MIDVRVIWFVSVLNAMCKRHNIIISLVFPLWGQKMYLALWPAPIDFIYTISPSKKYEFSYDAESIIQTCQSEVSIDNNLNASAQHAGNCICYYPSQSQ